MHFGAGRPDHDRALEAGHHGFGSNARWPISDGFVECFKLATQRESIAGAVRTIGDKASVHRDKPVNTITIAIGVPLKLEALSRIQAGKVGSALGDAGGPASGLLSKARAPAAFFRCQVS